MENNTNSNKPLTHFELVGEFHDTFGHPNKKNPYYECFSEPDKKLLKFRLSLMREEYSEFTDAVHKNDIVEMADALCDLLYVTYGAGHALGLNLDLLMDHYDLSYNAFKLSNLKAIDAFKIKQNDLNILSGNIDSELNEIKKNIDNDDSYNNNEDRFNYLGKLLCSVLYFTYKLGSELTFKMDEMFREVHRSNMTKTCNNMDDVNMSIDFYKKDGRYANPSYKISGKYYVIYDAFTSKILKNHKWEEPNLKQLID